MSQSGGSCRSPLDHLTFEFIPLNFWKIFVMPGIFERDAGSKESEPILSLDALYAEFWISNETHADRAHVPALSPFF